MAKKFMFYDLVKYEHPTTDNHGNVQLGKLKVLNLSNESVGELILYYDGSIELAHDKECDINLVDIIKDVIARTPYHNEFVPLSSDILNLIE